MQWPLLVQSTCPSGPGLLGSCPETEPNSKNWFQDWFPNRFQWKPARWQKQLTPVSPCWNLY